MIVLKPTINILFRVGKGRVESVTGFPRPDNMAKTAHDAFFADVPEDTVVRVVEVEEELPSLSGPGFLATEVHSEGEHSGSHKHVFDSDMTEEPLDSGSELFPEPGSRTKELRDMSSPVPNDE